MKIKIKNSIPVFFTITLAIFFLWIFFVSPEILKIKKDFTYQADITSVDNFFDAKKSIFKGEQYSQTNFYYEIVSKEKNVLGIKNVFDVKTLDGQQVYRAEPIYKINAYTREHVDFVSETGKKAFLFAPLKFARDETFYFFSYMEKSPFKMKFDSEEYINGLKVYKYTSIENKERDETDIMTFLPGVPEEKGIKLTGGLSLWIEPISGHLVNMEDFSIDYYYFDIQTGEKLYPYNKFSNTYTEQSILEHVDIAKNKKNFIIFIKYLVPVFIILILILLFLIQINSQTLKKIHAFLKNNKIEIGMLFLFTCFSVVSYQFLNTYFENERNNIFEKQSNEISQLIKNRMDNYVTILLGSRGLFEASDFVDRNTWKTYADSLNIEKNFSGVQGIGFSKVIYPEEKDQIIQKAQEEGLSDFKITPVGVRDIYTSIIYLEPFNERNQRAFGYDMFSESTRNKAMVLARDTGKPSISGKVTLLQEKEEDTQSGFLIYVPVYKKNSDITTIESRTENIFGYVYSPFRVNDLMQDVLKNIDTDLEISLYDGLVSNEDNRLFNLGTKPEERKNSIMYRKKEVLNIAGHPWTIEYVNSDSYQIIFLHQILPKFVLFVGILLGILLSIIFKVSKNTKEKALNLAAVLTQDLEQKVKELDQSKKATLNILEDIDLEKQKLTDLTTRFELAKSSAHIGIWEWDIFRNTIIWDENMYELYQREKGKFDISYDTWFKIMVPQDEKHVKTKLKNILKNKEKDFDFIFSIITPKGEKKYMHIFGTLVYDLDFKPIKIVGINLDITKEKEIDQTKTEFVSLASHQLKTPIGAIKWNIEMLLDEDYGKIPEKQKNTLIEIYEMTKRMNSLVTDFLNISRIDLGTFIVEPKKISYVEVCENVLVELQNKIKEKKHTIIKEYEEKIPELQADPKLLHIIFQNLISNAVKYTHKNGQIKISIKRVNKKIQIAVYNNGESIPKEDQNKIFSKMFRASNAQSLDPDGNGLGLYLLKSIVEAAGGKTWFISNDSEGTTFFVEFSLLGMKNKKRT